MIVIFESNHDLLKILVENLEANFTQVNGFNDFKEAVNWAKEAKKEETLIFVCEMSGSLANMKKKSNILKQLRKEVGCKVILISTHTEAEDLMEADGFIEKFFKVEELIGVIKEIS